MRITLVTAFPDMVRTYLSGSVLGRGIASGLLDVEVLNLRDFAEGSYRQVDDYAFGGGGMVLMAEPLARAVESAAGRWGKPHVLLTSPQGVRLDQTLVETLSGKGHLLIVCGHYEGVDERFVRRFVDLEVSLGDFVLTGGELPALAIVDAVARLVPGVVGCARSVVEDSFYLGLLDCPHETRPADWRGEGAEPVLLGGDPAAIHRWRRREQVRRTLARRPDLVARAGLMPYLSRGAYVLLACAPVRDRGGERGVAAVTPPDLHDLARTCRTYGVRRLLVATPVSAQREMARRIVEHGTAGSLGTVHPDRPEALRPVKTFPGIRQALGWVASKEKARPYVVGTAAKRRAGAEHWIRIKQELLSRDAPLVLLFGMAWGLHEEAFAHCDAVLSPLLGGGGEYNHLSVRSAATAILDRLFGFR